jgi:hypothetical protein
LFGRRHASASVFRITFAASSIIPPIAGASSSGKRSIVQTTRLPSPSAKT